MLNMSGWSIHIVENKTKRSLAQALNWSSDTKPTHQKQSRFSQGAALRISLAMSPPYAPPRLPKKNGFDLPAAALPDRSGTLNLNNELGD